MTFETILYEKKDHIAWITLNRPEVRNAQNDTLRAELTAALEDARLDDDVRVIVLTGAGEKAFCAGADISEFPTMTPMNMIKKKKGTRTQVDQLRAIPKPVIAMVNGLALGGGCETALACDIIIAAGHAKFGQPEINVGVIPGAGGTQVLPRLVGEKKAKELIFTGDFITAEEALRLGLVNAVVPLENLKDTVQELADKLISKSPAIMRFAKLAVNKSLETPLSVGLDSETDYFAMCFGTEDQKEASTSFLEKRKPEFKGR